MLKEWIVTLHKHEDLADFYEDMETPGGNLFIPNRAVGIANKRPTSRNTHYMLTTEEAQMLKADDRVWDVELAELIEINTKPSGYKIIAGSFSKNSAPNSNDINWGLLRHTESANRANWGADGTENITSDLTITASGKHVDVVIFDGHIDPQNPEFAVNSNGSGGSRVIQYNWFQNDIGGGTGTYVYTPYVDDAPTSQTFVFQNPGFAYTITSFTGTNPAITLVRGVTYTFNFQSVDSTHPIALRLFPGDTSAVPGTTGNNPSGGVWGSSGTVTYTVPLNAPDSIIYQCVNHSSMVGTINIVNDTSDPNRTLDNNHGCLVASTAAGNTQGWARDANIYNISIYATNPNNGTAGFSSSTYWDFVRAWHNNKPVNPVTGRKNPTITNHSYGSTIKLGSGDFGEVTRVFYRGVDFNPGRSLTLAELRARGFYANNLSPAVPHYFTARISDIQDAINDGMIVVAAAGNDSWKITNSSDQDYINSFRATYFSSNLLWMLHRGSGSAGAHAPVITVGSLSDNILENKTPSSNCGSQVDVYAGGSNIQASAQITSSGTADPRNVIYRRVKVSGTSFSAPQVAGLLALLAESRPNMTQAEAHDWIINNSDTNQIFDTQTDNPMDTSSLQGSQNLIARWYNQRGITGSTFPQKNFNTRPTSGIMYPRTRIRKRG